MTDNTFPVYKLDVIVNFFRTEVLTGQEAKQLTKNDLTPSPNPDTVRRLYMRVLQLVYNFRPECHSMVPLSVNIQYPAFHEYPTAIMSVYLRMRKFLPMCFVYDFSLSDLLAPSVKRTVTVLSGIMNFLHFRKQRMDMALEHLERFRADMDKLQFYTNGIKNAEKKIENLTTIPPEQQEEDKKLSAALSDLQTSSVHKYEEVNAVKEEIAEWKTEIAERSQKRTQMKVDVSTLKEEIGKLESQVVESPEEVKAQMEKMKENVKNIKISIKQADERLVGLQITVRGETHHKAELELMHKLLQDLQSGMNKTQQLQEEVQKLEVINENQQKELRNLGTEESQLKRALGMKLDKESKQQIRRQRKKERTDQHVQGVIGQYGQVHQKREEIAEQILEKNRETMKVRNEIQNMKDICNQETEKAQALFDQLMAALDQFHKKIESCVVEGNNDIKKMTLDF
ncbi:kinetochore protein Nuf2 [Hypomesus transpacificus]|uniref:kinetochore protein Nuf2 n=1 Tax=Hypomesus transpacificus TaxID=137520 RepID=UPI001F077018|nr:kinetochore protein Nuf2 [Hypomesus transpacificus]